MKQISHIKRKSLTGFTLLEVLIVIAIIAVASALLIFVLNPAEILRKGRDSQRLADLKTLHLAIAFLITVKSNIQGDDLCGGETFWPRIYISYPKDKAGVDIPEGHCPTPSPPPGSPLSGYKPNWRQALTDDLYRIDGNGYIPVDFTAIPDSFPISRLPVDPVNLINIPKDTEGDDCPDDNDLVYRYTCFQQNLTFELDTKLESREFTVIKMKSLEDGGTNDIRYEVGTALNLLP